LARRTFDESGNYTVRPFQLTTEAYATGFNVSSTTEHAVKLGAGKAYIGGYEYETISPRYLAVSRGLDTNIVTQRILSTPLKNYVNVLRTSSFGSLISGDQQLRDTFTKSKKATVQRVNESGTVQKLGTCNIRTIEEDAGGEIKLYLFNINMSATGATNAFSRSTHIAINDGDNTDNTQRFRIGTIDSETELHEVGAPRQIFKAPVGSGLIRASGAGGLISSFLVKRAYNFELSSGSATITSTKPFLPSSPLSYTIFYSTNSSGDGATMLNVGTDIDLLISNTQSNPTLTLTKGSNIPDGGKGTVIASQQWKSDESADVENNIRTKTLVDATSSGVTGDPATGIIQLDHCDVYSITDISDNSDRTDLLGSFDLEVNSGVDAYRRSRLVLKPGATCSLHEDGSLVLDTVNYKRFAHSGNGPFTVDSYPLNQITYDEIPDFTDPETGETYSLADAYDFRPIAADSTETSFVANEDGDPPVVAFDNGIFPSTVSYEHHLGRIDSVVLDRQTRDFKIVQGVPSIFPKSPEVDPLNMNLGNLIIPPYTRSPSDIKYRYIDNQRSTMMDINEQEQSQQFDSFFTFKNDLEQEALNRAQNFRSSRTAFSDGIFVDTFIGHNNSVTRKRDHNCSIDPEFGELRPAFESTFFRMGITGASLSSDAVVTTDNIYIPKSQPARYTFNELASRTISANQFSVPDYLGTMTLSPSSDNFFTSLVAPKVIVNTIGEVDNWEANLNAFQRGRSFGFGSQWRDWETLWFGSKKRNDVNIEHDSAGSNYTNPRRSSYVSRVISDKLIKRIGNKIVDLSVVPFANPRTITFKVENLKKDTAHYLYFDGERKTSFKTDSTGAFEGDFTILSRSHLTGKKLVRVTDNVNSNLSLSSSSADATYYAEGLLECKEGDSYSVRPVITRRKASNVDDVSSDYYDANSADNLSRSYNSQTPFAQEIFVDPTNFPNGIMLKDIELFFAKVPQTDDLTNKTPVKVHVRPMYNGSPHPFKVLPFSESTETDISLSRYDSPIGEGKTFEFSTPVYLKPNTSYAICISTNGDYQLYYGEANSQALSGAEESAVETSSTIRSPKFMGAMHIPLNNGTSTSFTNRFLKMTVNRCTFVNVSDTFSSVLFKSTDIFGTGIPYHVGYIHSNEQPSDSAEPDYSFTTSNFGGGKFTIQKSEINTTIDDFETKKIVSSSQPVEILATLKTDPKLAVASMIDGDRLGFLAIEYMANNDDAAAVTEELQPTARLATNRSRYVGRKVTLDRAADDIVVIVDGSYVDNSQIKVYVKLQGPDQPNGVFDDNDYEELFPEGNPGTQGVSAKFAELKPEGPVGGVMRFTTNNLSPGTNSEFTSYQIKIVLMGQDVNNEGNARQIPVINTVSAVPLRRVSQDEIRRYVPPGTIMQWGGGKGDGNDEGRIAAPFGFVNCNGGKYNYIENPEYTVLFEAIGNFYNTGDEDTAAGEFRVPNLKGRTVVGRGTNGAAGIRFRGLGQTGGWENIQKHTHGTRTESGLQGQVRVRGTNTSGNVLNIRGRDDDGTGSDPHATIGGGGFYGNIYANLNEIVSNGIGPNGPNFDQGHATDNVKNPDGTNPDTGGIFNDGIDPREGQNSREGNMMPFIVLDYIIKI